MRLAVISFALLLVTSVSCKKAGDGQVCFKRSMSGLTIENKSGHRIYFTAFLQSSLPLIDWAPTCTNVSVDSNGSVTMPATSLWGGTSSEPVVVYWWECPINYNKIRSFTLPVGGSACK